MVPTNSHYPQRAGIPVVTRVWFNKTFSSVHSALRLIRSADADEQYELIVSSANPHALAGLVADRFQLEPHDLKGSAYIDWCLEFCRKEAIHIFVPGKESTLISENRELFEAAGVRILSAARKEHLDLINNKQRFYETACSRETPPAGWRACSTLAEFDSAFEALSEEHAALCIKPAVSVYGIGFRRIRTDKSTFQLFSSGSEYQITLASLRTMLGEVDSFPTLLVMEYLGGHEYSVDCIADSGLLKCAIVRKKSLHAGHGQLIDDRPEIVQECELIVDQFGLNGMVNIQFREGEHGVRVLEVNPRMSGGIAMACLAGPNLPYLGLTGFDRGYDNIRIPPIQFGLRVGEFNQASVFA